MIQFATTIGKVKLGCRTTGWLAAVCSSIRLHRFDEVEENVLSRHRTILRQAVKRPTILALAVLGLSACGWSNPCHRGTDYSWDWG